MIVGPVTDLRNYRDYTDRFEACLGARVPAVEVHLIHADLQEGIPFVRNMIASAGHLRDRGVDLLSYHLLDDVINDLILYGLFKGTPAFAHLLPDRSFSDAKDTFDRMLEGLLEAGDCFGRPVIAVVHEGIFLDASGLDALGGQGMAELLGMFEAAIPSIHRSLFAGLNGRVRVFLENSPLNRGMRGDRRHVTDQVLGRMAPRLAGGEALVLDVSHRFLYEHVRRGGVGVNEPDGYEDVRAASAFVGWVHLNDCSPAGGGMEGMPLFQADSLIDWERMIGLLRSMNAPMILEIEGAERDFSLIEGSLSRFRAAWRAAVEDGGGKR